MMGSRSSSFGWSIYYLFRIRSSKDTDPVLGLWELPFHRCKAWEHRTGGDRHGSSDSFSITKIARFSRTRYHDRMSRWRGLCTERLFSSVALRHVWGGDMGSVSDGISILRLYSR